MNRRTSSSCVLGVGLLVLVAAFVPIAHLGDAHHTDECLACHFAQHSIFDLNVEPTLAEPNHSLAQILELASEQATSLPATTHVARGPPLSSR